MIDDRLNTKPLMTDTIRKLNYVLSIFKRVRSSLTFKSAIKIFKAKFLSYIDYPFLVSYMASAADVKKNADHTEFLFTLCP